MEKAKNKKKSIWKFQLHKSKPEGERPAKINIQIRSSKQSLLLLLLPLSPLFVTRTPFCPPLPFDTTPILGLFSRLPSQCAILIWKAKTRNAFVRKSMRHPMNRLFQSSLLHFNCNTSVFIYHTQTQFFCPWYTGMRTGMHIRVFS